jgi:hypothetical protein
VEVESSIPGAVESLTAVFIVTISLNVPGPKFLSQILNVSALKAETVSLAGAVPKAVIPMFTWARAFRENIMIANSNTFFIFY